MKNINTAKHILPNTSQNEVFFMRKADLNRVMELKNENEKEAMEFLTIRPAHTIVMASFIKDNGIESDLNRGKFFGYRDREGNLEGIALIGHSTLIEARTEEALQAFAEVAKKSETPLYVVMSHGDDAERFWNYYSNGLKQPKMTFNELLFELSFPFMVKDCKWEVRNAMAAELMDVAEAQAEVAFIETGSSPLERDREGFLKRCLRRIEQKRSFVVYENGKLVFKADVVAETSEVAYLEGVYVSPEYRGQNVGSSCLSKLSIMLMDKVQNVCLLSNSEFPKVHESFMKAGFKNSDSCKTLFV
jgi:uncharacterized protein